MPPAIYAMPRIYFGLLRMTAVQVEPLADKFEELDASRAIVREDKIKQAELRRRLRNAQETQPLLLGGVDSISVGILTLHVWGPLAWL
jgi:hypothetical protein